MACEVPEQVRQQSCHDEFHMAGWECRYSVPLQGAAGRADQGDGSSEDAAEQGRGSKQGVQARLDAPGGQQPHQDQPTSCAEGRSDLQTPTRCQPGDEHGAHCGGCTSSRSCTGVQVGMQ